MTAPAAPQSGTYSESAKALDEILAQFKEGKLSIEESIELFETGVQHLKVCQSLLKDARGKVEVLVKSLQEDGEMVVEPFSEDAE